MDAGPQERTKRSGLRRGRRVWRGEACRHDPTSACGPALRFVPRGNRPLVHSKGKLRLLARHASSRLCGGIAHHAYFQAWCAIAMVPCTPLYSRGLQLKPRCRSGRRWRLRLLGPSRTQRRHQPRQIRQIERAIISLCVSKLGLHRRAPPVAAHTARFQRDPAGIQGQSALSRVRLRPPWRLEHPRVRKHNLPQHHRRATLTKLVSAVSSRSARRRKRRLRAIFVPGRQNLPTHAGA